MISIKSFDKEIRKTNDIIYKIPPAQSRGQRASSNGGKF